MLNAPKWIGIDSELNGEQLDLHKMNPVEFRRELNMQQGYLERTFAIYVGEARLEIASRRFLSMKRDEIGAIRYAIR